MILKGPKRQEKKAKRIKIEETVRPCSSESLLLIIDAYVCHFFPIFRCNLPPSLFVIQGYPCFKRSWISSKCLLIVQVFRTFKFSALRSKRLLQWSSYLKPWWMLFKLRLKSSQGPITPVHKSCQNLSHIILK